VVDEDLKCQCSYSDAYLPSERGYGRAGHEPADPLAAALFGMRDVFPGGGSVDADRGIPPHGSNRLWVLVKPSPVLQRAEGKMFMVSYSRSRAGRP